MRTPVRALAALVVSTTLLAAGCGSSTSGSSSGTIIPSTAPPSPATFSRSAAISTPAPLPDSVRWHPAKHLAPAAGWSSDPSGLVYENGTYHVFYRHNPAGTDSGGAVEWAHATSTDLVTWTEQPVAIAGSADDRVLSGSVVVDGANTSGLGTSDRPPMVAISTSTGSQDLSLAASTDHGQTWQQYSGNPVLSPPEQLSDPKVSWYGPGNYWLLVGALADSHAVQIYRSADLTDWSLLSEVSGVGVQAGRWGSPDLFPLALDGDPAQQRWVLLVSTDAGGPTGGSGVQYFVGSFDGTDFTAEPLGPAGVGPIQPGEMHSWMDWGSDFLGATTFAGAPDGRTMALGWLNNRAYADAVPTEGWRGSMTLPRELSLSTVDGVPRLLQTVPTEAAAALAAAGPAFREDSVQITNGNRKLADKASGTALEIDATLVPGAAAVSGVTVLGSATGQRGTRIQYVTATGILQVDRTTSGQTGFSAAFAPGAATAVPLADGRLDLRIVVDGSTVEVFAGDGKVALTSLAFPAVGDDNVALFAGGGKASVQNVTVTKIAG